MAYQATVVPSTPVSQVTLEVIFDVDQVGSNLSHKLCRMSPDDPNPQPVTGVQADSMSFVPGEQLFLKVTGNGAIGSDVPAGSAFVSFQIIDCVIITQPQIIQIAAGLPTLYAAPSPFQQAVGACCPIALDFTPSVIDMLPSQTRSVTQTWKQTLDVGLAPGMWELSLVLTIRIMRGAGAVDEVRVLSFDPEAEVGGNGTLK